MTVNELIDKITDRVQCLADQPIDDVRAAYPETTETVGELVRMCKDAGYTRGQMIADIICDEFEPEFTVEIDPDECEGWFV